MIHILYTSIVGNEHNNLFKYYLPQFSIDYQKKIQKYRRWEDAQLSLLGRALLINGMQQLGKKFIESDLRLTSYNKPYFKSNIIEFNISHSGEVVVCVFAISGELGIDVEKIMPIEITDFKPQMTLKEWKIINFSKNRILSFYNYWTQKEAVIKAHGKGLSIPLKSFEIQNNNTTIHSKIFFLKKISLFDNYCCHLALNKNINDIDIKISKINPFIEIN